MNELVHYLEDELVKFEHNKNDDSEASEYYDGGIDEIVEVIEILVS